VGTQDAVVQAFLPFTLATLHSDGAPTHTELHPRRPLCCRRQGCGGADLGWPLFVIAARVQSGAGKRGTGQ
jgi:hypothetical protein